MTEETAAAISEFGTADDSDPAIEFYGGRLVSALPITLFICWAVFQSGVLGIGDTTGLVAGMFVSLTVGLLFVDGNWKTYADVIFEGMTQRVAATAIVAWLWAGVFCEHHPSRRIRRRPGLGSGHFQHRRGAVPRRHVPPGGAARDRYRDGLRDDRRLLGAVFPRGCGTRR